MNYFWVLKSGEVDFYESEASFVIPMLEMVRMKFKSIKEVVFKIEAAREWRETEES